jgi:hypothetical protein
MPYGDPANFIGHTISTDVKDVPYLSLHGFRYVVNFIDHHSRFSLAYFMRSKTEVTEKFKLFCAELGRYGFKVRNLQSDRGSEYYAQEGATMADRDRALSELDGFCKDAGIRHTVNTCGDERATCWGLVSRAF